MELILGDCLEKLKELEDNSVDAIVTDPPYGLSFMGKKWDYDVPKMEIWQECLRVLKPGGYLLSFAGTRTQHRMAVNIEDAGFEIRDMIAWVYASGFPKSLNIGKAVDKLQGNEREILGRVKRTGKESGTYGAMKGNNMETKGTSEWEGWGTALKPALEPITVARKPLGEKTVAENCLKWGVGGINIDGCRVKSNEITGRPQYESKGWKNTSGMTGSTNDDWKLGRFPANLIHDGSEEVVGLFPNDSQRFFYTAKASKRERNMGCEGLEEKETKRYGDFEGTPEHAPKMNVKNSNNHPTVKPLALMEYLVKMVSREGQVVLDPFMGSGTTGMACKKLGRDFVGIEMMEEYMEIAKCRIEAWEIDEQLELSKLTTK